MKNTIKSNKIQENEDFNELVKLFPANLLTQLNLMKQRELQIENLCCSGEYIINIDEQKISSLIPDTLENWNLCKENVAELVMSITDTNKYLTSIIPESYLKSFENKEDIEYTKYCYGKAYWNEIPQPTLTDRHFNALKTMLQKMIFEIDTVRLYIYDMGYGFLPFNSQENAERFITHVETEPYILKELAQDKFEFGEVDYEVVYTSFI